MGVCEGSPRRTSDPIKKRKFLFNFSKNAPFHRPAVPPQYRGLAVFRSAPENTAPQKADCKPFPCLRVVKQPNKGKHGIRLPVALQSEDMKKAPARSGQGKKEPAHMGPAVLDPIFNIPGASDHATSTGYHPHAGDRPQSAQRCSVSSPACKGVALVFFHFLFLHLITVLSIHS